MDPRFSALPYSAQAAVRDATKVLHMARRFLAAKTHAASRADYWAEAAAVRARGLRAKMIAVSDLRQPSSRRV